MAKPFIITQGQRAPSILFPFQVDGQPFDLTSAPLTFSMRPAGSSTLTLDHVDAAAAGDPTTGICRYDWADGDTATAGTYDGWFTATQPGSQDQDSDEFDIEMLAHATPGGDLTSLEAVKAQLKKTDENDDIILLTLINAASSVITAYCRRQFVPDTGNPVTHRFRSSSRIIPFRNFDLQAAATVTLNPQSTSPQVLTEWTDYELLPLDGDELLGTYTYLKLHRRCWNRGQFIVDIDGTWGAATIPPEVAKACDVTVAEWFRSKVAAFSTVFNDEGVHVVPAPLPTMVCGWLEPYRRVVPFL